MNSAQIREEDKANISLNPLNTSIKSMFCNHCQLMNSSIEDMKIHYKSDLHRYNLTRITSNLRPLTQEEFDKKKAHFENLKKTDKNAQIKSQGEISTFNCATCRKQFVSKNKFTEHLASKSHQLSLKSKENSSPLEEKEKRIKDNIKTTVDDSSICAFCNESHKSLNENFEHMKKVHELDIPLEGYLKDIEGCIRLIATKIFTYKSCLGCDNQNFDSIYSLQNHMIDKKHSYINIEDLEDHLFAYYDKSKLSEVKDNNIRLTQAFKILKFKLKLKPISKSKVDSDDEELDDDEEPMELPNGELLLQNGRVLGNKIYNIYYKQRVRLNRYEGLMSTREFTIKMNRLNLMRKIMNKRNVKKNYFKTKITDKNKNIMRQNTLFRACKQVNV